MIRRRMTRAVALAALLPVAFSGVAVGEDHGSGSDRAVRIVGSGYTMPRFTRPWAERFEQSTGQTVEVVTTGTSTGPPALIEGQADIAAMTRPMNEPEAAQVTRRLGAPPTAFPVAEDYVVVFVNEANPLDGLTLAQVDAIYSEERRCGAPRGVSRWGQVGVQADFAERSIALFGRRPGSGTASFFRARALCGGPFKKWMRISPGTTSASLRVVESRFGIGFGSLRDRQPGMKAIAIAESEAGPYVSPVDPDATDAPYPLRRTLDLVIVVPPSGDVRSEVLDFLEHVYSEESQTLLPEVGYQALSAVDRERALEQIRELREGASSE